MFKNFSISINFTEGFVNYNCERVKYNSINTQQMRLVHIIYWREAFQSKLNWSIVVKTLHDNVMKGDYEKKISPYKSTFF